MFQIKIMRADYEGWWLFDGWQEKVITSSSYQTEEAFKEGYKAQLEEMRRQYPNEIIGKHHIHAFYRNCELEFCEECDEDVQIYHSVIPLKDDVVLQDGKLCKCIN